MKNKYVFDMSQYDLKKKDGKYILTKKLDVHEWAEQIYIERIKADEKKGKCKFVYNEKQTICVDCKTLKVACSKCHPEDTYNITIGTTIAYCRLYNIDIPRSLLTTKQPSKIEEQKIRKNLEVLLSDICHHIPCEKCPINAIKRNERQSCTDCLYIGQITDAPTAPNEPAYPLTYLQELCKEMIESSKIDKETQEKIKATRIFTIQCDNENE